MYKKIGMIILALACLLVLAACGCEHVWQDATCLAPATCALCSKTEGEIGEHIWQDATCDSPKTCATCGTTEGKKLEHQWEQTSICTVNCELCGVDSPDAPGHQWVEATCKTEKNCPVCELVEGEPIPHDWVDANCSTPKTCTMCGTAEGEALGHTLAEGNDGVTGMCTVCNKLIEYYYENDTLYAWTEYEVAEDGSKSNPVTYRKKSGSTYVPFTWYSNGKLTDYESIGGSSVATSGINVDIFCVDGQVYYFVNYHSDNPKAVVKVLMNAANQYISFSSATYSEVQYTSPILTGSGGWLDTRGYSSAAYDAYGNPFAIVHKSLFGSADDPTEAWAVACDWRK